jgi:hypothetical protein
MSGRLGEMAEVAAAVAFLASADAAFVNATDLKVTQYSLKNAKLWMHIVYTVKRLAHRLNMEVRSPKFIWALCHVMCTAVLIG